MVGRKITPILCLACLLSAFCLPGAYAAEKAGVLIAVESSSYRAQNWKARLVFTKELMARLRTNNCPIALTPEDLMRKVDSDILQRWDPEQADANMGMRICQMLQLDFTKCVEGR